MLLRRLGRGGHGATLPALLRRGLGVDRWVASTTTVSVRCGCSDASGRSVSALVELVASLPKVGDVLEELASFGVNAIPLVLDGAELDA